MTSKDPYRRHLFRPCCVKKAKLTHADGRTNSDRIKHPYLAKGDRPRPCNSRSAKATCRLTAKKLHG